MDHDGVGNITQDVRSGSGTYAYTMNHRNRLAAASVGGTQVGAYVYDALERLAIRTTSNVSPAGTTHFAYDLSGKVLIEANGANGATVREYVWFNDMPLAIVANVDTASPQLLHVHADHLDRPIMLTNGSRANVWEAVYRPFGEVHAITGTATQNLRSPGQYFLFETGLAHNWHRTYDATIGRYLQADPLGFVDGPSVYSYVRSSPVALVDPFGQQAGSISRRPIWQPPPQSVSNICQQYPGVCRGWIPVAVQILKVCPGLIFEMAGGGSRRDDQCETAKSDARRIYNELVNERLPQYLDGNTPDKTHRNTILQKQAALQDAIRRVRQNCRHSLPPELNEWEAAATRDIPILY